MAHARPQLTIRLAGTGPALAAWGTARMARGRYFRRDCRLEQGRSAQVAVDPGP